MKIETHCTVIHVFTSMSHTHDQCQAIEGHFLSRITLRGVDLTIDSLTGYRVTAAAGSGQSILQTNAASADGSGLTTPIVTRRIAVAGPGLGLGSSTADAVVLTQTGVAPIVGWYNTSSYQLPNGGATVTLPITNDAQSPSTAGFTLASNVVTVPIAGIYTLRYVSAFRTVNEVIGVFNEVRLLVNGVANVRPVYFGFHNAEDTTNNAFSVVAEWRVTLAAAATLAIQIMNPATVSDQPMFLTDGIATITGFPQ